MLVANILKENPMRSRLLAKVRSILYRIRLKLSLFSGERAEHSLNGVLYLITDRPSGYRQELLRLFETATQNRHPYESWSLKPEKTVLYLFQSWFGLSLKSVVEMAWARGALWVVWAPEEIRARSDSDTQDVGGDFRTQTHNKINLWSVACYQISLETSATPDEIDITNPSHRGVVAGAFGRARKSINEASAYLEFYKPDSVVYAQGYDIESAVLRHLAVKRGIRVVALENIFRKDRLLWDDVSGIAVNKTLARNYYWRYSGLVDPVKASRDVRDYLSKIGMAKSEEHASPVRTLDVDFLPAGKTLLFIGQVMMDSSILFGLPGFESQVDVISSLAEWASAREVNLIVKLHPKESPTNQDHLPYFRGVTHRRLNADARFSEASSRMGRRLLIDFANDFNTYDLIRRADACVTVTSQAGLEALLFGKELVVCGEAFYAGIGITHEAGSHGCLRACLEDVLFKEIRRNRGDEAAVFFHIYSELYCLPKTENALVSLALGETRPLGPVDI